MYTKLNLTQIDLTQTGSFSGSFSGSFTGQMTGTGSYSTQALSSSYSVSSSYSLSSSFAATASYALNATSTAAFPYTGSARITGSLDVIGPITGSFITGSFFGTVNNIGIPFTYTFGGIGIPSASVVTTPLKIFTQTTCISASLSAQTAPSTTTLIVRIQRATSVTGSFSTLYSLTLTSGSKEITEGIATADILNKNDVIRALIASNDVAADWVFQLYTERRSS